MAAPGSEAEQGSRSRRAPWQVTRDVWYALFMREAVSRTMADRFGWFWMIFEPIALTLIMVAIRSFIRGGRVITGAEFIPWLIVGLLGFFMVREGMTRSLGAINASQGLFAYRQLHPVDPVIVRYFLEGLIRTLVFVLFIVGGLLLGIDLFPDAAISAMGMWAFLWAMGLGLGLVVSVLGTLIPEVARIVRMISLPLLILSGVIIPLQMLPRHLLEYLMYNPIAHALELLRQAFFEGYRVVHGTELLYPGLFVLSTIAIGLMLQIIYAPRLKAK